MNKAHFGRFATREKIQRENLFIILYICITRHIKLQIKFCPDFYRDRISSL